MSRRDDVLLLIAAEVERTGAVPPPTWTAEFLKIDRAGVSRIYHQLAREGRLAQPHGERGSWALIDASEVHAGDRSN